MGLIIGIIVNTLALLAVSYIIPGFEIDDLQTAVVAAIVIGVINTFIRPIVQLIALPISLMTLGVFAFIINVLLLMLAAHLVPGFAINGFLTAILASIVLGLVSTFLHKLARA
jgi:putative membrane protein